MKVLVACEFSGTVRNAFRSRGHESYSVDLLPSVDESEYHWQMDAIEAIRKTKWDLLIAHPPCTALCVSGNRHYSGTQAREEALDFFRAFLEADVPKICVENPVGIISSRLRKPTQYVQPWQFGHSESKKTGLWLKGLAPLKPTKIMPLPERGYWDNQTPSGQNKLGPSPDRGLLRSITYKGIADAMAEQWGDG